MYGQERMVIRYCTTSKHIQLHHTFLGPEKYYQKRFSSRDIDHSPERKETNK
jgi:hypothetical protein